MEYADCQSKAISNIVEVKAVMLLQLFEYYVAASRDCGVDEPRNPEKSVTAE